MLFGTILILFKENLVQTSNKVLKRKQTQANVAQIEQAQTCTYTHTHTHRQPHTSRSIKPLNAALTDSDFSWSFLLHFVDLTGAEPK